jgi:hypothetical protein
LAVLSADGKRWSYVDDTTSKSVTKSIKGTIKSSSNGLSVVEVAGRDFVIDKNGDRVGTNQYEELNPFIEGIASFRQGNLWGAIDSKATVIIPAEYQNELLFKNGLAKFFFASSKYGFVDKSGTVVLSATYDDAEDFQEGLAAVKSGALWCFIDKTGASVIPPQFSQCYGGFVNGRCFVRVKDSPYISIIDKTGKRLAQLPLQCRNIIGGRTIISERAAICQILDWDWDDNGRQVPVDQDGKLLPGFGGKNVKYWKSEGLFVVSGPAG